MRKKRSKNIYDKHLTYDNIYSMWKIIKKTCNSKERVLNFSLNINTNIMTIYNQLKTRTYIPDKFKTFVIYEPKARLIMNQTISDKIVNHFITNYYLLPYLENSLIYTNIATRKGKGGSLGINLLKKYFNILLKEKKEIYCLKMDVSKYFYNIDHEILINKIRRKIKDEEVINLIKICIEECGKDYVNEYILKMDVKHKLDIPTYKSGKGLSIGAEASQFLAIYYLNDIDHYIKEDLKCKFYLRYMDDLLILDTDLNKLKNVFNSVKCKIENEKLCLNKKSNIYKCSHSFKFLGYSWKVVNNKLVVSTNNKTYYKINKNLKKLKKYDPVKYYKSKGSYKGYFDVVHEYIGDDFKLKTIELYNAYKEKYKNTIVIIKEGIFYKTFNEDAIIIWNLFKYKLIKNAISFGTNPYNKVLMKLKAINISFIVVDKNNEIINYYNNNDIYSLYEKLAAHEYSSYNRKLKLYEQLDKLLIDNENYEKIEKFFESLSK